jgi:hypothetical protein
LFSLLEVKVFDVVGNWVENPPKNKNLKTELFLFLKKSSRRKRYVMKGKTRLLITQI